MDIWDDIDLGDIRRHSIALSEMFIAEVEALCPMLTLASPRDPSARGSQASFQFEHGYAAMQALIAQGVIGDFRAPDLMRFGFAPLYIGADDVKEAARRLAHVMQNRLWDDSVYQARAAVT